MESKPSTYMAEFHSSDSGERMQYRQLGQTDMEVSVLSFGASALGGVFRSTDDEESSATVKVALKSGINYIDTAPWYGDGRSESVLGNALKGVPRQVYYIATKVGRYNPEPAAMFDFSYQRTLRSVDESLQRLQLPYVDIIQAHDVEFAPNIDIVLNETLPALAKVKADGKARYIGVTGYPISLLKEVVERSTVKIDTILTYCRYSMNDTTLLQYKDYFSKRGVGIINASPLSMGLLSERGPPAWHPAKLFCPHVAQACSQAAAYCTSRGVDLSRLALHFSLSQADCATCLVSTASTKNMTRNLNVVSKPLTALEKEVLDHVMSEYMKPLNNANWEGKEAEQLQKELRKKQEHSSLG